MPQREVETAHENIEASLTPRNRAWVRVHLSAEALPRLPRRAVPQAMPQRIVGAADEDVEAVRAPRRRGGARGALQHPPHAFPPLPRRPGPPAGAQRPVPPP